MSNSFDLSTMSVASFWEKLMGLAVLSLSNVTGSVSQSSKSAWLPMRTVKLFGKAQNLNPLKLTQNGCRKNGTN